MPRRLVARKNGVPSNIAARITTNREQTLPPPPQETDDSSLEEVSKSGETENRQNDTGRSVEQPPKKKMKVGMMYIKDKPPAELTNEKMVELVRNITNKFIFPYNKYEKSTNEVDDQLMCLVYKEMDWNKSQHVMARVKFWKAIETCVAKCIRENRHYITCHLRKIIKGTI